MALWKNTVRLHAAFSDFDDNLADPTSVTLYAWDVKTGGSVMNVSGSYITRESLGTYFYDFTVLPPYNGMIEYEWQGILEGNPIVNRGQIIREHLKI